MSETVKRWCSELAWFLIYLGDRLVLALDDLTARSQVRRGAPVDPRIIENRRHFQQRYGARP